MKPTRLIKSIGCLRNPVGLFGVLFGCLFGLVQGLVSLGWLVLCGYVFWCGLGVGLVSLGLFVWWCGLVSPGSLYVPVLRWFVLCGLV